MDKSNGSSLVWKVLGPILASTLLGVSAYMYVTMASRVETVENKLASDHDRLVRIEAKLDAVLLGR